MRLLDDGHAVMIFPEASRSPDGKLQRFKLGAFRLACARSVPVLPVTILGGHEAWPPGRVLPRPGRLTIVNGLDGTARGVRCPASRFM